MNNVKLGFGGGLAAIAVVIAVNCFTIVNINHEASVSSFGEVHEGKVLTGFNWVLPHWDIEEYSLEPTTETYDDIGVPSQDKFKTSMDVVFTGAFISGNASKIRATLGTDDTFLDNHVYKRILSCTILAGGEVKTSQEFFNADVQNSMYDSILNCTNDYLATVTQGYRLSSIQIKDINLDKQVRSFMVQTKQREEQENEQQSKFNIAALQAKEKTTKAEENAKASVFALTAAKNVSNGKLYDIEKMAEGNIKLAKSLTPELVEYTKAQRWNGQLPTHSLGTNSSFLVK